MIETAMQEVSILSQDGTLLHLEGSPGGTPVLVLHGLGYASWAALPLRRHLAGLSPDLGIWSLDNRGTGGSDRGSRRSSVELLAADAALAAERLGGGVHVVGYSMGGYIAQVLAARRPDLVASVVLMSTSGGGAHAVPLPESTRRAWLEAASGPPDEYARRTMPLSFRPGWPEDHPKEYQAVLEARLRRPTPAEVWREQYEECEKYLLAGCDIERLTAPALVLHGGADRVLPVENGRALANALPAAVYQEYPAAGHLLHIEEPARVAADLSHFFSRP